MNRLKRKMRSIWFVPLLAAGMLLQVGCKDEDLPPLENPEESIDKIILIFSPTEGAPIQVNAVDPDGEGSQNMVASSDIVLKANTDYELFITFENTVTGEKISDEVSDESDEHMLFFEFTNDLFESPSGNGNMDNRADQVNYLDKDANNLPLGLITGWVTGDAKSGTFRFVLKHQPDIKSATSGSTDGASDIDFTWNLVIEE